MLHNELHIMEPAKVVILCTLLNINSMSSASSLALISNNNEVLIITNMIDILTIYPHPGCLLPVMRFLISQYRSGNHRLFTKDILFLFIRGAKVWGRSQCLGAIHWGPFIFHWGTSIVIPFLIGGAQVVTLVSIVTSNIRKIQYLLSCYLAYLNVILSRIK